MIDNRITCFWKLGIGLSCVAIYGVIFSFENCTFAQITPDDSLGAESSVVKPVAPLTSQIEGGAIRGTNLFHSFEQFSVPTNGEVRFNNSLNIQNIITRVTGASTSNIDGLIKAKGTANLFLINPHGVIFGPNASLNIGGSFLASTASSLNFADGSRFSVTASQTTPLLTVNVPVGLQFGATPGTIINRSQASSNGAVNFFGLPAGLQVLTGKTLALVGGDVLLEGGSLTAEGGRIQLGSVADNSLVSLQPTKQGWTFSYEGVRNFQNIQLTPPANFNESGIPSYVDTSGEGGGEIQLQGRLIRLTNSPLIAATTGGFHPGNLSVTALESVELIGNATTLTTLAIGSGDAGDITINSRQLIVRDGAQVFTSTSGKGSGGQLNVIASDSVQLIGSFPSLVNNRYSPSALLSSTVADGNAGNLTINTGKLLIQDGALVSTESSDRFDPILGQFISATGRGGNLTVNASDFVELTGTRPDGTPSSLLANTKGTGNAGNITITTKQLFAQNKAEVAVSSEGTGDAGNLDVTASSIRLDNQGKLTATSASGEGGNIRLSNLDLLLLRNNSEISTSAGGSGQGGNINIDTNLLIGTENSDITANAFEGEGGFIQIAAQGIFGLEVREQLTDNSDITAFSQKDPSLNGVVEVNRPDVDPTSELVVLPAEIVDVSGLVAQGCAAGGGNVAGGSQFVVTGRGGLPPNPTEATRSDPVLADLGSPVQSQENRASADIPIKSSSSDSDTLVEAQGWVIGSKGEVVLTAAAVTPDIPWLTPNSCHGS
jgi:filamentous hemagglutinin family protein